jgi:glutamate synthase (NADPH/NADH) small chain
MGYAEKSTAYRQEGGCCGFGASGLSTAYFLNTVGHEVTVYERSDRAGGLLMYGIPNMKLDKAVVERRLEILRSSGVLFVLNTEVGRDIPAQQLVEEYDAVVLCCGATKARGLNIQGSDLKGVHFAVDFLKANTKSLLDSGLSDGNYISAKDKHVIVIGGGDTGTDCVATSLRHGCSSVYQFEIMPQPPQERIEEVNPWPEWPKKLKVDYGQQEAICVYGADPRNYLITAKKLVGNERGELEAVHTVGIEWCRTTPAGWFRRKLRAAKRYGRPIWFCWQWAFWAGGYDS